MLVVALARNAPASIAGQKRSPNNASAAMATPVGGQTGEMDGPMLA